MSETETESPSPTSEIPIASIHVGSSQPRTRFDPDALEELAASIRAFGVLQPVVVRPIGTDRFELIAGERRLRAAKLAGLTSIPAIVRSADPQSSLEMAIVENVQREDISPMECARALLRLQDEFGMRQDEIAARVGKSRVAVANLLRLLRLPDEIQTAIDEGVLSEGHGRAILMVEGQLAQLALFHQAVRNGWSVRETERAAQRFRMPAVATPSSQATERREPSAEDRRLAVALREFFGAPVRLERNGKVGRLVVEFHSDDDLQRLLDVLGVRV
jgi:ParB family chromosome partitioning protein